MHILKYLSFKERKHKALVSKSWYIASVDPMFMKDEIFVFSCAAKDEYTIYLPNLNWHEKIVYICDHMNEQKPLALKVFVETIIKSKRQLLNIKLTHVTCRFCLDTTTSHLFNQRGLDIKSLYITHFGKCNSILSDTYLNILMFQCRNLETLSICGYKICMETYNPKNALLKLKNLYFCWFNNIVSDTCFKILMEHVPNINTLCLGKVDIDPFLYKDRDDLTIVRTKPNELNTCLNVTNYLKTAQNITTLKLDILFQIFLDIPAHIQLKSLQIDCFKLKTNDYINFSNFKERLGKHLSLEELEISYMSCCLFSAISKLHNLRYLKIKCVDYNDCSNHNMCFEIFLAKLNRMKYIKELSIDHGPSIDKSIFVIPIQTYSLLTSFEGDIFNTIHFLDYAKNLTSLSICNGDILTSSDFQFIFNMQTNLRHLQINKCTNFEDDTLLELNLKGNIMFQP